MPAITTTAAAASTTLKLAGAGGSSSNDAEDAEVYDEIEIEDMSYDADRQIYTYPCPCGDQFEITLSDMYEGQDIAVCPSCSLTIRVIFESEDLVGADKEAE
ncbi:diphthamide biosynthesis protein 3 [Fonsecaea multimorphosa CBS 102226]|uniref:Diphthamide biosynthesis protein 3 n=1 Tax=Fonsecaea multimorphosa CBS 102226 TaxID=1442371 RepID=A0A0D2GUB1_9EURO|nr:diphthamide biosynthesis protein 3 [Fonsecaea multimorphosa CBS 102226]KIX93105.1 diphthamide biosynthesis protein 3 [Fonsecaea multimorphosa CBS 102226]OAL18403.1 diphthamide biosynthesis protein 3 [Fonsecaea multimorphosa]